MIQYSQNCLERERNSSANLPASTTKKVVAYRFDRQSIEGFVRPTAYLASSGVELISASGFVQVIPYDALKALCFVNEAGRADLFRTFKAFERRPRIPGLWARFIFVDGDRIEGVLTHNMADWPREGFVIVPPRASGSRQRVFIPREAVRATELRGVVAVSKTKTKPAAETQLEMFDQP
jgi:hypothetical protein